MPSDLDDELSTIAAIKLLLYITLITIVEIFKSFFKFFIPSKSKNVAGQLALITGGSRGIGRSIAFRLASEGCHIAIVNRNFRDGHEVAERIMKEYPNVNAKAFSCDVSKVDQVKKLKIDVENTLGVVDILINNAGIFYPKFSLLEGDDDEIYQKMMDVNITSYLWTCRAFLPSMIKQRRGHIVSISSLSALASIPNQVCYTTTKYGNKGFINALREEMAFYGFDFIKTTCAFPAMIDTNDEYTDFFNKYFYSLALVFRDVDDTADVIVDGILRNKKNIYVPIIDIVKGWIAECLPRKAKTIIIHESIKRSVRHLYIEERKETFTG